MQDDLTTYLSYYHQKFQGRKLDWDHALGTATLKARFKAGEKELSVSLYQAVILLLFNDGDGISYADIKEHTRLGKSHFHSRPLWDCSPRVLQTMGSSSGPCRASRAARSVC